MAGEGLSSLFPLADIAVMGISAVIGRLPLILRRINETVGAIIAAKPDGLVIIDSPDFTHRVARRVRSRLPDLPIIDYVSPSVWAWRPKRALAMRRYIDHVLALLPFEPQAHRRLGGPPCTYVGHPLSQRLEEFAPSPADEAVRQSSPPTVLVLPGSRRSEVSRLLPVFGETLGEIAARRPLDLVLPAVPWLAEDIAAATRGWRAVPRVVTSEQDKLAAFRQARVALAASGTVALELALAGVPMVGAYKVGVLEGLFFRAVISTPYVLLPNLILGEMAVPELLQTNCTSAALASALAPLLDDTPARGAQLTALALVRERIAVEGETPAVRAAEIVAKTIWRASLQSSLRHKHAPANDAKRL
jgi:lipid-A-disaccharide synthase